MKTRRHFLNWIDVCLHKDQRNDINKTKFLDIKEETYVYKTLATLSKEHPTLETYINDYIHLENQRYQIMAKNPLAMITATTQIERGIRFCAKTTEHKKKAVFLVNPSLSSFLATSIYPWGGHLEPNLKIKNSNYLFIPSFLALAPKEVFLVALPAALLDIKDYKEAFTYSEFLGLVSNAMQIDEETLAPTFLEFMTTQVLYYNTLLHIS